MGFVAVDDTTIDYLGPSVPPKGDAWDKAVAHWRTLKSDEGRAIRPRRRTARRRHPPQVTWGTSPEMVVGDCRPCRIRPGNRSGQARRHGRALQYMGLRRTRR